MQQSFGEIADGAVGAVEGNAGQTDVGNTFSADQLAATALIDEPCSAGNANNQRAGRKAQVGNRIGAGGKEEGAATLDRQIDGILKLGALIVSGIGQKAQLL